jgi:flagellar basal-body rod modification protein FlgD
MTTVPINKSPRAPAQIKSASKDLKSQDFINMMIAQLQNQDPLEPAKNQDILAQMSQIGQLQSNTQLQDTLKGLAIQSQLGSAGGMIGKMVEGLDNNKNKITGLVNSVRVESDKVFLELDNGNELGLGSVTKIAPGPNSAAAAATTTTTTTTPTTSAALAN